MINLQQKAPKHFFKNAQQKTTILSDTLLKLLQAGSCEH